MKLEFIDRLEAEIKDWRAKLDGLTVKANLAKLELEEGGDDLMARLTRAYDRASDKLRDLKVAGEKEWDALRDATEKSWAEFKETYRTASEREGGS